MRSDVVVGRRNQLQLPLENFNQGGEVLRDRKRRAVAPTKIEIARVPD
jgi:hypothetical protein